MQLAYLDQYNVALKDKERHASCKQAANDCSVAVSEVYAGVRSPIDTPLPPPSPPQQQTILEVAVGLNPDVCEHRAYVHE